MRGGCGAGEPPLIFGLKPRYFAGHPLSHLPEGLYPLLTYITFTEKKEKQKKNDNNNNNYLDRKNSHDLNAKNKGKQSSISFHHSTKKRKNIIKECSLHLYQFISHFHFP